MLQTLPLGFDDIICHARHLLIAILSRCREMQPCWFHCPDGENTWLYKGPVYDRAARNILWCRAETNVGFMSL